MKVFLTPPHNAPTKWEQQRRLQRGIASNECRSGHPIAPPSSPRASSMPSPSPSTSKQHPPPAAAAAAAAAPAAASKPPSSSSSAPSRANAAAPAAPLTDAELLDLAGEESLKDVNELNLRSKGLHSLSPWIDRLPNLAALSLSHNCISSLQGLLNSRLLTTINLNFNQLTSLEGIQHCSSLLHLFAANNMVRDLTPLAALLDLRTLSMYRNAVASLDVTLTVLGALPLLQDLELGGNPCSLVPGYKARMVLGLPSLQVLDGEALTQLDNEMAEEQLFAQSAAESTGQDSAPAASQAAAGPRPLSKVKEADVLVIDHDPEQPEQRGLAAHGGPGPGQRPGTASLRPGTAAMRPGTASLRPGTAAMRPGTAAMRPGTGSQRPTTASVRLISNEFLNEHPILLEYLARNVLSEGLALVQQGAGGTSDGLVGRLRCSFVSRLRSTAATNLASESMEPKDIAASGQAVVAGLALPDARAAALETLVLDASPEETIRQLVRLCEVLIKEVEAARQAKRPGSSGPGRPGTASASVSASPSRPGTGTASAPVSRPGSSQRPPSGGSRSGGGGGDGEAPGPAAAPGDAEGEAAQAEGLKAEVARLSRQVQQLQQENQNMYWLAAQYKTMKAELLRLNPGWKQGLDG